MLQKSTKCMVMSLPKDANTAQKTLVDFSPNTSIGKCGKYIHTRDWLRALVGIQKDELFKNYCCKMILIVHKFISKWVWISYQNDFWNIVLSNFDDIIYKDNALCPAWVIFCSLLRNIICVRKMSFSGTMFFV